MIKAIFFDVDGTLLSHTQGAVPTNTRQALEELRQKGIKRVVATGRHMLELQDMPVNDIDFDAYITLNGQYCFDREGNVFFQSPIRELEPILELFRERRIPIQLVEKSAMYMNFVDEGVIKAQNDISTPIPPVGEYAGEKVYQAIAYVTREQQAEIEEKLKGVKIIRWHENAVDLMDEGGSKVTGIEAYLDYMGYAVEETAAFGDGENDMEMLRFANVGIAMENARETVKSVADFVTTSVDEDGITNGLRFLGI